MSDEGQTAIERLQEIMTALMERLLLESLESVDGALGEWKSGEAGVFETHAELLRHAAKAERLAERMARIGLDNAGALLRDAFDAGLVEHDEFVTFVGKEPAEVNPSPPLSEEQVIGGLPDKRVLIEELLGQGPVLLHIDARHPLSQVPDRFRQDPKLVLRFGYDLTPAIIDLSIDSEGMYGTLTFGGIPTRCVLPWGCIYSVVSEADQRAWFGRKMFPIALSMRCKSNTAASKRRSQSRAQRWVLCARQHRKMPRAGHQRPHQRPHHRRAHHLVAAVTSSSLSNSASGAVDPHSTALRHARAGRCQLLNLDSH